MGRVLGRQQGKGAWRGRGRGARRQHGRNVRRSRGIGAGRNRVRHGTTGPGISPLDEPGKYNDFQYELW